MSGTTSVSTLVERLDAEATNAARDARGRAADRTVRDAEPVADAVVRSILRMPPRADLPEVDAIVKAAR